ncbi:MAG: methyltransferase domain-containing protein [Woeseiaceae bacterium]|nr:methyltransferase domain-containing protein [Woeseiaceae bacterium]
MSTLIMNRPHTDARFWDRIAKRYARKAVPDQAAYETKLAKTDSYLEPDDRVLEIGCGTGTTALHHAQSAGHILATDISAKMIDIAREKAKASGVDNVRFEVSSIDDLDATPGQYDVILAHSILHLVADVPRTLRQLHRMLKPGGLLISNTQCIGDSAAWLGWVAPLGRVLGVLPRVNVFREREFLKWIGDSGFDFEEIWQPKRGASHYIVARADDA